MDRKRFTKVSLLAVVSLFVLLTFVISAPAEVNTVRGPISPDKLGTTLMHEHFTFAYPGWFADATIAPEDYKAALKTNLGVIKAARKTALKPSSMPRPMTREAATRSSTKSWPRRRASISSAPPASIPSTKVPRPIGRRGYVGHGYFQDDRRALYSKRSPRASARPASRQG